MSEQQKAKGPERFDLQTVTDANFERLTYLLAHATNGDVVIVRNKDRGLDARLPDRLGQTTLHGWQAKRYETGKIHFKQCEASLDDAVAFWRPLGVTFVFASDLSATEQQTFTRRLCDRHTGVVVDVWSASEVERLLRDTEEGRNAARWLFGDSNSIEELVAAMISKEPVRTPAEIATRQAELDALLNKDPHFYYTTVSRPPGAEHTPPAPSTVASIVLDIGGREVRWDLSERYEGAVDQLGPGPMLTFTDDDDGRAAEETLKAAAASQGPVRIESGVGVHWPVVPVGLRGIVPDQPSGAAIEVVVEDAAAGERPAEQPLPMLVRCAGAELGFAFSFVDDEQPEGRATLVGKAGGLTLKYSASFDESGRHLDPRLDWRHQIGVGSGLDQLLSARVMVSALRGETIELLTVPERVGVVATAGTHEYGDDELAALDARIAYLEYVCEIQAWLQRPFFPTAEVTDEDVEQVGRALSLVRHPHRNGTWKSLEVSLAEGVEVPEQFEVVVLQATYIPLLGASVYLGVDMINLGAAKVASMSGESVTLVPVEGDGVLQATMEPAPKVDARAAAPRGGGDGTGNRVLIKSLKS